MVPTAEVRRIKRPFVLILLVMSSLVLVVVEMRSPNRSTSVGRWTVAVFSPFFEGGRWASDRLREGLVQIITVQTTRMENDHLKAENARLALESSVQRERILKLERERTSELPKLPNTVLSLLYANVIGISQQPWDQTLTIDRGELNGVRKMLPVVDFSGAIVGIVSETSRRESVVRLITDPGFSMGAMIEDNSSRDLGLLNGLGETRDDTDDNGKSPYLVRFRPNEPQKVRQIGMEVISTGFKNSLYPKGLRIGKIVKFKKDKYGTDYAYVAPYASFRSLEEVIVVDSQTVDEPTESLPSTDPAVPLISAQTRPSAPVIRPVLPAEEDPEAEREPAASNEAPKSSAPSDSASMPVAGAAE